MIFQFEPGPAFHFRIQTPTLGGDFAGPVIICVNQNILVLWNFGTQLGSRSGCWCSKNVFALADDVGQLESGLRCFATAPKLLLLQRFDAITNGNHELYDPVRIKSLFSAKARAVEGYPERYLDSGTPPCGLSPEILRAGVVGTCSGPATSASWVREVTGAEGLHRQLEA